MSRKTIFLLIVFTALSLLAYLLFSIWTYRFGFPLDDSWIHLTYARNLALRGEWSFLPGQNSAGSTSPLWTFLLAPAFYLPVAPYLWTYFLGGLMLFLLAWRIEKTLRQLQPSYQTSLPWAGLLILFEWHLVWAAVSGMEILLHAFLVTTVLSLLILNQPRFLLLGILTGLSVWSRPDGLTLLGPVVLYALIHPSTPNQKAAGLGRAMLGFAGFFVPYLLFNLLLNGTPWPNTFYAKQAEYAFWQHVPFFSKLWEFASTYFVGVNLFLLPAVIYLVFKAIQKRRWGILLTFIWIVGYVALYTERLPLYQYGRYIMPTIPVFMLLGLVFFDCWLPAIRTRWQRRLRFAWISMISLLGIILWGYGASLYARDVAWIESEMVQTALWTKENLPQDALVAVHDIGALGYFNPQEQILDLAGLVSPEIIPIIRDEEALAGYLEEQGATHLIIFPGWYPVLAAHCEPVYVANGPYAGLNPLGKMTVYDCRKP